MSRSSSKDDLRKMLRAKRQGLSSTEQKIAARRLTQHVIHSSWFRASRRIASYFPNDGEIDPAGIVERSWRLRKSIYLPVLPNLGHNRLWFAPVTPDTEYTTNRYGIAEPIVPARSLVRAEELDLILLPLVAFDISGHRLGMGGGFYDKSLEFLHRRQYLRRPHLLGLAHDFQRVPQINTDSWDVTLVAVATDTALYVI